MALSKVSLSLFSPFPVLFFQSHSQNHCDLKLRLSWSGLLLKSTFYVWHRCVFCTLPVVPGVVRHPPLPPGDLTGTVHQPGRGQCLEEYVPIIWRYSYFLLFYVANSNISQKKFSSLFNQICIIVTIRCISNSVFQRQMSV